MFLETISCMFPPLCDLMFSSCIISRSFWLCENPSPAPKTILVAQVLQGRLPIHVLLPGLPSCQKKGGKPPGLLKPLPDPTQPWAVVTMDFITDVPPCKGKDTTLVVVDSFSKQVHFIPCAGLPAAKKLARLFLQNIAKLHRFPDKVVSDHGSQLMANFWREFLALTGIDRGLSSSHHPQTDGQTECLNQV